MFYKMIIKVTIDRDIPKHHQKEMQTSLRQIAYVSLELNKNSWTNQGCMWVSGRAFAQYTQGPGTELQHYGTDKQKDCMRVTFTFESITEVHEPPQIYVSRDHEQRT